MIMNKCHRCLKVVLRWSLVYVCVCADVSVFPNALVIGDVDNDRHGDNEVVVGSIDGNLEIFKTTLTQVLCVLCVCVCVVVVDSCVDIYVCVC